MAKKIEIPDELKADLPPTKWGKLLAATPIVMTVIATMLAGLSSSEMTKAQYDRALAAQLQSKAGDQWGYFQAKKLRAAVQHNTLDLLEVSADVRPVNNPVLEKIPAPPAPVFEPAVKTALDALTAEKPETEIAEALKTVSTTQLAAALLTAKENVHSYDKTLAPANEELGKLEKLVAGGDKDARRDALAAKLHFVAGRYDAEAKLNQTVANVLELQVRKNNISADHHHKRSAKFFYGMLAAQLGVIISTFAMAARQRNALWLIAAAAGITAVAFAVYVYLCV